MHMGSREKGEGIFSSLLSSLSACLLLGPSERVYSMRPGPSASIG